MFVVSKGVYKKSRSRPNLPKSVFKDGVKWILVPTKILLDYVALWPENYNKPILVYQAFLFLSTITILVGQINYINDNSGDFTKTISGITDIMLTIEILVRQITILYNKEKISKLLVTVYFEFWPSNVLKKSFQKQLRKETLYIFSFCCFFTFSAFTSALQYFTIPIIFNIRELPFSTHFSLFNWQNSPYYEMLLVWESFMCSIFSIGICGFDILVLSLLWNCIGQFKILHYFLQSDFQNIMLKSRSGKRMVLIKILKHHQNILRFCKDVEDTFTFFILSLALSNTATVCLPSFLGTIVQPAEFGKVLAYFMGHFSELLVYCFLGSELIYESTALSKALFECNWHLLNDNTFKKTLLMMIVRSQKEVHLTAAGFSVLKLPTFLKILRLSFSFYTLLNSVLKRK